MIVVDSLDYTRVQKSQKELLPFLNEMGQQGIIVKNMYSEAPYTEAAAMALYAGQHTLDNNGYIERYKYAEKLLFEVFSENDYDVFFNALQPQCYPSSLRRGINNIFYNRGYDAEVLWRYRLDHFSKVYLKGEIDEFDIQLLIRIFDDNFEDWLRFFDDILSHDESIALLENLNKEFDASSVKKQVISQYEDYKKNKKEYIIDVLIKGQKHSLFSIPYFSQVDYNLSENVVGVHKRECKKICKKLNRKNMLGNLLFNFDVLKTSVSAFWDFIKGGSIQDFLNAMYLVKNTISIVHIKDRYGNKVSALKGQPSFYTMSQHFLKWLDEREDEKPFFACLHVDDIHFPEEFFSYDTDDYERVQADIRLANDYLDQRSIKEPGTVIHDLSLVYADNQCRLLYDEMKKRGLEADTIFIVTADHGFSYSGYPIRKKAINTFYLENFRIPFFAFGKGIEKKEYSGIESSVSIPATICRLAGIVPAKSFLPPISNDGNDTVLIEYCGGGCPDLRRREIMLAAFDKKKMVAIKADLKNELTVNKIVEVYDLVKDPQQRVNLVSNYVFDDYKKYYDIVKDRFEEIRKSVMVL